MCYTRIKIEFCRVLLGKFYLLLLVLLKGYVFSGVEDRLNSSEVKGLLGWGNRDCFIGMERVLR